ncbi:MAG: GTP-binding protein [Anaerolineae bacterium]|nr:GTP-binding protein [Anaerolineae bacterium]
MKSISKKVCLVGDFAVGKTSLVRRFVYNKFDDKYISTIGVKVSRKTVTIPAEPDTIELTMMLWDLAGSEEFNPMRASYLRGATGAVLVFDLTRPETLPSLAAYIQELHRVSPEAQFILAANKLDLVEPDQLPLAEIEEFAGQFNAAYYLTSAKNGDEVETMFRHLGRLLI